MIELDHSNPRESVSKPPPTEPENALKQTGICIHIRETDRKS